MLRLKELGKSEGTEMTAVMSHPHARRFVQEIGIAVYRAQQMILSYISISIS